MALDDAVEAGSKLSRIIRIAAREGIREINTSALLADGGVNLGEARLRDLTLRIRLAWLVRVAWVRLQTRSLKLLDARHTTLERVLLTLVEHL